MQATIEDTIVMQKTRDLCETIVQQPEFRQIRERIDVFMNDDLAKTQYQEVMEIMKREPLDFIGVDYAVDAREVEQAILPLAQERKIAVLAYQPFGRTRLWNRVGDRPVPEYAKEFDATTWAQFFIKWVASHPAITVVTPATSQAKNMMDNLGGGRGRMPDAEMRKRMIATIEALPAAR